MFSRELFDQLVHHHVPFVIISSFISHYPHYTILSSIHIPSTSASPIILHYLTALCLNVGNNSSHQSIRIIIIYLAISWCMIIWWLLMSNYWLIDSIISLLSRICCPFLYGLLLFHIMTLPYSYHIKCPFIISISRIPFHFIWPMNTDVNTSFPFGIEMEFAIEK